MTLFASVQLQLFNSLYLALGSRNSKLKVTQILQIDNLRLKLQLTYESYSNCSRELSFQLVTTVEVVETNDIFDVTENLKKPIIFQFFHFTAKIVLYERLSYKDFDFSSMYRTYHESNTPVHQCPRPYNKKPVSFKNIIRPGTCFRLSDVFE